MNHNLRCVHEYFRMLSYYFLYWEWMGNLWTRVSLHLVSPVLPCQRWPYSRTWLESNLGNVPEHLATVSWNKVWNYILVNSKQMWQDTQPLHYKVHLYKQKYTYTVLKYSTIHNYFGNTPHLPHVSTLSCLTHYQLTSPSATFCRLSCMPLLTNSLTWNAPTTNLGFHNVG
jgi:hypothetical protein